MSQYPLGRIESPDPRDQGYRATRLLPATATVDFKTTWRFRKPVLRQEGGTCVGHAWKHFKRCAPIQTTTGLTAYEIYDACTQVDVWPENDNKDRNFGTSVRAGAEVLTASGNLKSYVWNFTLAEAVSWLLHKGPLVFGTDWTNSMFEPDAQGVIRFRPESGVAGGHAWLARGVDVKKAMLGPCPNSWGPDWGKQGEFWIPFEDVEKLFTRGAESCAAVEQKLQSKTTQPMSLRV